MSLAVISTETAARYRWGVCEAWHLVNAPELSVIQELMPPQSEESRHFHTRSRQFFFVLEGELTLEVEHQHFVLKAQQGLEISPGQAHQALNLGQTPMRMLVISQPHSHGDRINL